MNSTRDFRYTMRVTIDWMDDMRIMSADTPLSVATFIQEAAKLGAPELKRRLSGAEVSDTMEDK